MMNAPFDKMAAVRPLRDIGLDELQVEEITTTVRNGIAGGVATARLGDGPRPLNSTVKLLNARILSRLFFQFGTASLESWVFVPEDRRDGRGVEGFWIPGSPSHGFAPLQQPRTIRPCLTMAARPVRPPATRYGRHRRGVISGLNHAASPPAGYASREALPYPAQLSLPAGGLHLCRVGVEPAGLRSMVSAMSSLPPLQDFA